MEYLLGVKNHEIIIVILKLFFIFATFNQICRLALSSLRLEQGYPWARGYVGVRSTHREYSCVKAIVIDLDVLEFGIPTPYVPVVPVNR